MVKIQNCLIIAILFYLPVRIVAQTSEDSSATFRSIPDSSFVIISAIQSISGKDVEDEFFDINLMQFFSNRVFGFGSIDVALSSKASVEADTLLTEKKLTEANYYINYCWPRSRRDSPLLFAGVGFRIFDGVPYLGFHLGGIQASGKLHTSYLAFGYLRRAYKVNPALNELLDTKEHEHNLFISMAIHSREIPFLHNLRIKGGLLIPTRFWNYKPRPTETDIKLRMVLEIPIGSILSF